MNGNDRVITGQVTWYVVFLELSYPPRKELRFLAEIHSFPQQQRNLLAHVASYTVESPDPVTAAFGGRDIKYTRPPTMLLF